MADSASAALAALEDAAALEEQRRASRAAHGADALAAARRSHAASRSKLKTDFKKCSGFVSRMRGLQENQRDALARDAASLNLGRYVEEIVTSVADAPLKPHDVPVAAFVCGELHRRYEDFGPRLVETLQRSVLPGPKAAAPRRGATAAAEKAAELEAAREEAKRRRAHLRLLLELFCHGIAADPALLERLVATLCGEGPAVRVRGGEERAPPNLPLLVQSVKVAGPHLFAVVSTKLAAQIHTAGDDAPPVLLRLLAATEAQAERDAETDAEADAEANAERDNEGGAEGGAEGEGEREAQRDAERDMESGSGENRGPDAPEDVEARDAPPLFLARDITERMRGCALRTLHAASTSLQQQHQRLSVLRERCLREEAVHGELREDKASALSDLTQRYEKLHMAVEALSDGLGVDMPELRDDEDEGPKASSGGISLWEKERNADEDGVKGPYENEEERAFYCDLPDLLSLIPRDSLGLSENDVEALKERNHRLKEERLRQQGFLEEAEGEESGASHAEGTLDDDDGGPEDDDDGGIDAILGASEADADDARSGPFAALMRLLTVDLMGLQSASDCDAFVMAFCVANSSGRGARKRLVLEILRTPKERIELLPFFARVLAALAQCFDDVGPPIVDALRKEAYRCTRKGKDADRFALYRHFAGAFIGELVKANVAPPNTALRAIRSGLREFSAAPLQLVAILWERCGKFLTKCKHTYNAAARLLDDMMQLLKAKFVDPGTATLLENAYFSVKPPQVRREAKAAPPPLHQFVRYLLLDRLSQSHPRPKAGKKEKSKRDDARSDEVRAVTKLLRKLPWSDETQGPGLVQYTAKCVRKSALAARADGLKNVVAVLEGLHRYHPEVTIRVVDRVFEDAYQFLELRGAIPLVAFQRRLQLPGQQGLGGIAEAIGVRGEESVLLLARRNVQQRVGYMRLLSELFHVKIVSFKHIYRLLHLTLARGHEVPEHMRAAPFLSVDPRMPSLADGPEDVSRIQMALTVLESCGPVLAMQPAQHKRLGRLLAYLQRYLYAKALRPAHIEWATLDVLDMLDRAARAALTVDADAEDTKGKRRRKGTRSRGKGAQDSSGKPVGAIFPTYRDFTEAHAAICAWEEEDAKANREPLHGVTSDLCGLGFGGEAEDGERDDGDGDGDGDADGDEQEDDDQSDTNTAANASDVSDASDSEDNSEDEEEDGVEEEESVVVRRAAAPIRTAEDDLFERELGSQLASYTQMRLSGAGYSGASDNMVLPTVLPKPPPGPADDGDATAVAPGKLQYRLLRRVPGKGKLEARVLHIPADTGVAERQRVHEDKERRERAMVRDRVLRLERERERDEINQIFFSERR